MIGYITKKKGEGLQSQEVSQQQRCLAAEKPLIFKKTQMSEATYYLQTSEYQKQMFEHLCTFNWSVKFGTTEEKHTLVKCVGADYSH